MKTILATTDFTKTSAQAVRYAAALARDMGTELLVVHATHIPVVSDAYFDMRTTLEELQQEDALSLEKMIKELHEEFGAQLRINQKLEVGFTGDVIRDIVDSGEVGLVVMGIAHTDRFSEVVFGSTSTKLAGNLRCPVLIIPENVKYRPWTSAAFAFDEKNIPTGTGVGVLREIMSKFNSKLRFVHVNDNVFNENDDSVLKILYNIFNDLDIKTHFLNHSPNMTVEIIMDWIKRHKVTALVMVSRQHNLLWRMFNERKTRKVAFHSKVPVLVLSEK